MSKPALSSAATPIQMPDTNKSIVPFSSEGDGYKLIILPEAVTLRDELIEESKSIVAINDEATNLLAINKAAYLKGLTKDCEACRVVEKKPAKEYGEYVDSQARNFNAPAFAEIERLEKLSGAFVRQERDKAEAARQAEIKRQQEAQRAEEARLQAIADAEKAAASAKEGSKAAEKAAAEAQRLRDEQMQAEIDAAMEPAPTPAPPPASTGAQVVSDIQILELDLDALYASHPQCVTLTVNKSAVKDLVKLQIRQNKPINIPGLQIELVTKSRAKAIRSNLAIE